MNPPFAAPPCLIEFCPEILVSRLLHRNRKLASPSTQHANTRRKASKRILNSNTAKHKYLATMSRLSKRVTIACCLAIATVVWEVDGQECKAGETECRLVDNCLLVVFNYAYSFIIPMYAFVRRHNNILFTRDAFNIIINLLAPKSKYSKLINQSKSCLLTSL